MLTNSLAFHAFIINCHGLLNVRDPFLKYKGSFVYKNIKWDIRNTTKSTEDGNKATHTHKNTNKCSEFTIILFD